jgi:hypothetical protein
MSPTAQNLEALGAPRLAELLVDIAAADPSVRRRLRLVLAGEAGPAVVAREVQKRLASLAKARSFVEWNKIRSLRDDLAAQHRAIVDVVGKADAGQALDLLWRFMELVDPVMERCDDSSGELAGVFQRAADDLAPLALAAKVDPDDLARKVFGAVRSNGYAQFDDLIAAMAGALGPAGLARLKQRLLDRELEPPAPPAQGERRIIGYGAAGPTYLDEAEARHRDWTIKSALREIADLEGDVDGFIAGYDAKTRRVPAIAAEIAGRLLKAGRTDEAWQAVEAVDTDRFGAAYEWQLARLEVLEALDRGDEAQAFRWSCFAASLEPEHLRKYLKRLPDFDDVEAEGRAMALALKFPDVHVALHFLVAWPALDRASELVLTRSGDLDGDLYELLSVAGEALEARYPLASTLVRRAMIDFSLQSARFKRYPHAARHLAECAALAPRIADFGTHPTHDDYRRRLRLDHGRKAAFWQSVQALA